MARRRSRAKWERIIAEWDPSVTSEASLARQLGVKISTVQFWKYTIGKLNRERAGGCRAESGGLVEVAVATVGASPGSSFDRPASRVQIGLRDGSTVMFDGLPSAEYLSTLIRACD